MKKIISLLLALTLSASILAGCSKNEPTPQPSPTPTAAPVAQSIDIRLAGLKGPTSMGMVSLLEQSSLGKANNNYIFTMAGSADEITPKLIKGEIDIAAVPANLASVIYNNTKGQVKLLAINTLGVIYIVEKGDAVKQFSDLKGKTIYATGKGSIPEYALRYILSQNQLDPDKDVTIEWKSEPTEIVALMKQNPSAVAMLPQPYVTVAQSQVEGLRIAIDLNKEWTAVGTKSQLVTGVLVVKSDFAEKNPAQIASFLEEYKASTEFVNANVEQAAVLVEKYDIVKAPIAKKAIPYCNITYIDASEMKTAMSGYLQVLFDQNPKSIGGAMPKDDFYYEK